MLAVRISAQLMTWRRWRTDLVLDNAADHLRQADGLPELLVASFQAFEDIRLAARSCEELVPELLATFMTAADAAVSGRDAIGAAPSLTRAIAGRDSGIIPADGDVMKMVDALSSLGNLLSRRLAEGAATATVAADRAACLEAAGAAGRISALMAKG
jgi:hypothetical protein